LPTNASFEEIDLTSDESVAVALAKIGKRRRRGIASVIHLAAYFDLTGEPDPRYEQITVRGTERLLRGLQPLEVDQFIFASSMLVHRGARPGQLINEDWPLDATLPYRASKIETERLIHVQRCQVPIVYLRPAGVYDDLVHNAFLAHQIARICEGDLTSHVYPGDLRTGQSVLHLGDLIEAASRLIERRKRLPPELPLLLGEPEVMGYGELQREIGRLVRVSEWETWEIPEPLAKAGAWVETDVLGEEPFIRPWMVDIANDHYAIDITRARKLLDWKPQHSLRSTLPKIIDALKADLAAWYRANKLNFAKVAGLGAKAHRRTQGFQVEALMGAMGSAGRWRMMPWMVTFFFILIVPLGGVSIFFIIIQPIIIGTYCTLCLIAALAMLIMIPLTLDEVVAMRQYMLRSVRAGRPFWSNFFRGGTDPLGGTDEKTPGFSAPLASQVVAATRGVTVPWTMLASCGVGAWLMVSRLVFGTNGVIANSDHLVGALVITVAVCAMAEVARPLRFINLLFGLGLIAAPWLLVDRTSGAAWNDVASGLIIIALSLPRGRRSAEHYGAWDRYVV
jgi:nucleoside-diphosphate-sugar epimerase